MLTVAIATLALSSPTPLVPAVTVTKVKTFSNVRATAIATSPVGAVFAVASEDNQVRIIDGKSLQTKFQLVGHPMTPYAIAFSSDGRYLLSGDESARVWLWDARTGSKIREYPREKGHTRGIQALAFSPNGQQFASVGKDDVIKVWNTSGGHPIVTVAGNGANFYGATFLPNGALVTGTLAEGARIYAPKSFSLATTLTVPGGQGANDVAVNKAGTLGVTAGRDGNLIVWNLPKREKLASLSGHSDWVLGVAFAPNGRVAASSSTDAKTLVWDVKSYKQIAEIPDRAFVDSLVGITSDGKYLLTSDATNALQVYQFDPPQNR